MGDRPVRQVVEPQRGRPQQHPDHPADVAQQRRRVVHHVLPPHRPGGPWRVEPEEDGLAALRRRRLVVGLHHQVVGGQATGREAPNLPQKLVMKLRFIKEPRFGRDFSGYQLFLVSHFLDL